MLKLTLHNQKVENWMVKSYKLQLFVYFFHFNFWLGIRFGVTAKRARAALCNDFSIDFGSVKMMRLLVTPAPKHCPNSIPAKKKTLN
jgi:hypothetical protein